MDGPGRCLDGGGPLQLRPFPAPQPHPGLWVPAPPPPRGAGRRGLTSGDARRLGIVPVLDAGDQLAAALQRVPAHQGRLAAAALWSTEASGEADRLSAPRAWGCRAWGCLGEAVWAIATFFWLHHVGSQFPNQGPARARQ